MNLEQMIELLNQDLQREWAHMRFYLYHASRVQGLHCHEYKELLLKEAASEMGHVTEFSDMIVGLGGTPVNGWDATIPFLESLTKPKDIIQEALKMESEVVDNYVERMNQAVEMGGTDGAWIEIFYEKQVEHSREDVDHFRQILRGICHA